MKKQVKCPTCQGTRFFVHGEGDHILDELTVLWSFVCISCGAILTPPTNDEMEEDNDD